MVQLLPCSPPPPNRVGCKSVANRRRLVLLRVLVQAGRASSVRTLPPPPPLPVLCCGFLSFVGNDGARVVASVFEPIESVRSPSFPLYRVLVDAAGAAAAVAVVDSDVDVGW